MGTAKLVQGLQQRLHRGFTVQCRTIGGSDQHRRNLRIVTHFLFEHPEVQALGVQRSIDRNLHIGQQRPTIGGSATLLKVG